MSDREALAEDIAEAQNVPFVGPKQRRIADFILRSDWLADHDRQVAAAAVESFIAKVASSHAYNGADDQGQQFYDWGLNPWLLSIYYADALSPRPSGDEVGS